MQQATLEKIVSMSERNVQSPVDVDAIRGEFERVQSRANGISMLLLSTADGRALADWTHARLDPRRVAAMTNSFLTLGETLAREVGMSGADHATVSTAQGSLVVVRVTGTRSCTLAVLGDPNATLAVLLFAARECASRIRPLI
ncbi:roadblock/LC7 domain-containing protein [Luteimonas deserti]|uniref:Roadblock/LC7 domain-containing protein n=1 Tax=Luteimonas deserti TaxID=2752306 RepID=A0A7Z0QRV0_9GAMM|nr:roadblock/LC7 domain-containing protein [Luteimonas deserti]NYZ63699.1 roadblock/LC7 domain-containing protein [Luteimonas deserti]